MLDTTLGRSPVTTVAQARQRADIYWFGWFLGLLGMTVLSAAMMYLMGPIPVPVGGILFVATLAAFFYEPRFGLYFVIFFSLVGDSVLLPWYPFVKNLSSPESLLYIHSALIFSPLELYLALITAVWLGKGIIRRRLDFHTGPLTGPALFFNAMMAVGLFYGLGTGGDANVGLWEVRAIFYLPLLLVLAGNLLTEREHYSQLMWVLMLAIFCEGLLGTYTYFVVLQSRLNLVDAITEHSAAIHMNTLFVFTLAVWMLRGSIAKRLVLPFLVPPVLISYFATQRRASYIALGIALILMAHVLYRERRALFWKIAPIALVLVAAYMGLFWNSGSAIGQPAQAVRSIVAPESGSADESSNIYRILENLNVAYTITRSPLLGVGFGNKFHVLVALPDISFFIWWEYIVHNSILWIWMKAGLLGFLSLLVLISFGIMTGVRVTWRMPGGDLQAIALTATLYLIMHFTYAYVDMSWDTQSMLYVGVMLGVLNSLEHVVAKPVAAPPKRWPWQPDSMLTANIVPLPQETAPPAAAPGRNAGARQKAREGASL